MSEFKMPSLGADMDAGTLAEWKKKSGDPVKRGDIIAAVETAKGVIEIECFEDGVLDQVFFQAGQEVPVGQVLATISSGGVRQNQARSCETIRAGKDRKDSRDGDDGCGQACRGQRGT